MSKSNDQILTLADLVNKAQVEEVEEVSKLQSKLDEHRNVVKYLRSKLNEVNLLNAKLLFRIITGCMLLCGYQKLSKKMLV